jgi:hypothetical protein
VITREEWERKLNNVNIRKEDMNKLVMNFLVTEGFVEAAEKFRKESGTERILFSSYYYIFWGMGKSFLFSQSMLVLNDSQLTLILLQSLIGWLLRRQYKVAMSKMQSRKSMT